MQVWLFHSTHDPAVLAFAIAATGANLPPGCAPWTLPGCRTKSAEGIVGIANSDAIGPVIEADGSYVARAKITLTREPPPAAGDLGVCG